MSYVDRTRMAPRAIVSASVGAALCVACSSGPGEAGIPQAWNNPLPPTETEPVAHPSDRLTAHLGITMPAMHLHAIYIGAEGADGAPNRDALLQWIITSDAYWSILAQYGVGYGVFEGSQRIASDAFFPSDVLSQGTITVGGLDTIIFKFLLPADAGAGDLAIGPDAYVFFLPNTVQITQGTSHSCANFGGYHWTIGRGSLAPPYAVIAACLDFPTDLPISHELAEMATDPTQQGWYSNVDILDNGGEVADLCNDPVTVPVDLWSPTRLWSNAEGACVPP